MKIAQLLALVICVSVTLVRENLRVLREKLKTQNPNLNIISVACLILGLLPAWCQEMPYFKQLMKRCICKSGTFFNWSMINLASSSPMLFFPTKLQLGNFFLTLFSICKADWNSPVWSPSSKSSEFSSTLDFLFFLAFLSILACSFLASFFWAFCFFSSSASRCLKDAESFVSSILLSKNSTEADDNLGPG